MAPSGNFNYIPSSPTSILLIAAFFWLVYAAVTTYSRRISSKAPTVVPYDLPLTGAFGFWTHRWDWYKRRAHGSGTGNFSFHVGSNILVALSGEKGRRLFFESRELGFAEGYAVLFGQAPQIDENVVAKDQPDDNNNVENFFARRLTHLLKPNQLQKKLPTLISDVHDCIDAISKDSTGRTNPFESIYRVVFRLTIRMVGAEEIADSAELCERVIKYFEMIDASATATAVMFPKFPSPAILQRTYAGGRLYMMVQDIVKKRTDSGEKHDDALQHLIDCGDSMYKMVEFVVGALFAGLLNSGVNAAWTLCYLAAAPDWLEKCRDEVRQAASKYTTNPDAPLQQQLDELPLEAWESDFPTVDLCLRESIRLNLVGTAFRQNTSGRAIPTGNGNEIIPPGAFVTYATADVHHDPDVYPDPDKWDPSRYLPNRAEDKKVPYAYLGWGAARHPCQGMRFAKLEQNIITAYFLAAFDFELQDHAGNKLTVPPAVDINGHAASKPKVPQYLRVWPREK